MGRISIVEAVVLNILSTWKETAGDKGCKETVVACLRGGTSVKPTRKEEV